MWYRLSLVLAALFAGLLIYGSSGADNGFYVAPSVSAYEMYDDNVFFDFTNAESDFVTRVSPALELGYQSERMLLSGSYTFDAEAYLHNSELNSANVRSFGNLDLNYIATDRLTLSALADYTHTDTPTDLSLIPGETGVPGLLRGRTEARRTSIRPAASYQLTEATSGTVGYTSTTDTLSGTGTNRTRSAEIRFDQRTSEINRVSYGYMMRSYSFDTRSEDGVVTQGTSHSQTPWVGLSRDISRRTTVSGRAGPRFEEDDIQPYVLLSAVHDYGDGDLSVNLERDETTLLGESGTQEYLSVYATLSHTFGSNIQIEITPGYADVSQADFDADIFQLGVAAYYRVNRAVLLSASYDMSRQKVDPSAATSDDVSRNVVMLGVTFNYPQKRGSGEDRRRRLRGISPTGS
jgi:hypothetical protein